MKLKFFKRTAAVLLALCTALTCSSCGESTATALTVDGKDIRAGIYLYYVTTAYGDAMQVLRDGGEKFENCKTTKDVRKIMKNADIDGKTAEQWIQDKAVSYCQTFIEIEKEFDDLKLKLSGDELAGIESSLINNMSFFGSFYEENGIGEQSVKDIITSSYKKKAIWESRYGKDGSEGIKEAELYDYYKDNHLRVKYLEMPLKDGKGNLLKADGKAEIEKMANDYLSRLGKKSDSEKELMKEFDYLINEHKEYQTSLSKAAVTTTDDKGSTITTATTAKVTTAEETKATTTAPEETGTDVTTTTAANGGETTTTAESTTTAKTDSTTTASTSSGTTAATTTTTYAKIGYDTGNERILVVSTSASAAENGGDSTTTTTAPTYTPCEKVYNWFADSKTPYLKPELIKAEECYYIAVKLDLEDRMSDDDLWSESAEESVRQELYYDEFEAAIDTLAVKLTAARNDRAFRRYKVLEVDVMGYQEALIQSIYSSYYYN